MEKFLYLLLIASFLSCDNTIQKTSPLTEVPSNQELKAIYKADQEDRQTADIDWDIVSKRDEERQKRVYELLDSNKVVTSEDYANAAMVFQHGGDTIASGMAVKMMQKAVDLDSTRDKWLLAAAIDRDLVGRNKPQIFGTQFLKMGRDNPWEMPELDTTKITDKQRIEYGVETLAEQKVKLLMMNKKQLFDLLKDGKNIDEVIAYVSKADLKQDEYNLSEDGITLFGYQLMGSGKIDDALKILKLNTELYPKAFNTFDSYGECLVKAGNIEQGIIAYEKSLELNPKNEHAKKALKEIKK